MRGNLKAPLVIVQLEGSIPARAGEPCIARAGLTPMEVYPRACGGTSILAHFALVNQGLSPSALLHGQAGVDRGVRR